MRTKDRLENGRPRARTYSSFDKCTYEFIRTRLEPGGHFLDLLDHLWALCCLHSIAFPSHLKAYMRSEPPQTACTFHAFSALPSLVPLGKWVRRQAANLSADSTGNHSIWTFTRINALENKMKASSLETSLNDGNNVLKGRLYWAQMVICIVIVHVSPWNVQLVIRQILQNNVWIVCVPWMREHIMEIHYDQGSLCRG